MDILEATFFVSRRSNTQIVLHKLISFGGEICDCQWAIHELFFEFISEQYVHIVGEFVGFDSDEWGHCTVELRMQVLCTDAILGEMFVEQIR